MLGHELRNPLAALHTATELIDRQAGESFPRERGVMSRQLRHLARLVDDLLDVSRVTRGKILMRPEPMDLRALLTRVVQGFEKTARTQGVRLDLETGDPLTIRGDALRLEQIATNLISNAIKYTNEGGRVSVTLAGKGGQAEL